MCAKVKKGFMSLIGRTVWLRYLHEEGFLRSVIGV